MDVLLESICVYRGGAVVGRPQNCTAKLYAGRIDIRETEGRMIVTLPLAGIHTVKVSGAALILKGDPFKAASIEFMTTGRKLALGLLGVIPLLVAMYAGKGRKQAVEWKAKIDQLRPDASPGGHEGRSG